jgi:16S rRNA (guanine527-N7)-methyltransferase
LEFGIWNLEFGILNRYFPDLSPAQLKQLEQLGPLYHEWNAKINVISRKDIDNLYERHVLHSMSIARAIKFKAGTTVLDAGTGGGFPGIPLAILFPDVYFHLADSTAKKLTVINAIAAETGLNNITTEHVRLEDHYKKYDFVVSRAVASLDEMVEWVWKNVKAVGFNDLPNGILYLKGGEAGMQGGGEAGKRGTLEPWNSGTIVGKQQKLPSDYTIYPLSDYFEEPFFLTKYIVHLF